MLAADTMLGPYRIVEPIGAGGMGEVYRAVDTRLGREVAVKILLPAHSNDDDALRRFEQEARAAGMLNHPNILAIYDIGSDGAVRYIVSELLEGDSLRERIRQGPIHPRKAADYAVQIARGLAAAHDKGIIHRDLKPENLFLTRDGQLKILDFGLVKLASRIPGADGSSESLTLPTGITRTGQVFGTVGYMSPEQVRGEGGDHRSDIFAFGAILFEMLTGCQPFRRNSPVETLNAILKDEAPDFSDIGANAPPALERIVRHCLEKNPEERFQSARDLAFDIGAMSGLTSRAISLRLIPRIRLRDLWKPLVATLIVAAALAGAFVLGQFRGKRPPPQFKRITYRSGTILSARFAPDGQTIFYGARWTGKPVAIFSSRPDSPESRDLGFGEAQILAVSSAGQLAISLGRHPIGYLRESGTLAQVPIGGGAPRPLLEDVEVADWSPDGKQLAAVRAIEGHSRLEAPLGKVLYQTTGWIGQIRFSPRGDVIALIDHPILNDDRGVVALIDLKSGARSVLTPEYQGVEGLAWAARGNEVLFTAEQSGSPRAIRAVTRRGSVRLVAASAGPLLLHDVAPDGRMLVTHESIRAGILARVPGEAMERDLSWLDFSIVRDLSGDGKTILFSESGEAGGSIYGVYMRTIDGSPAVRLGDGTTESLSPDGKWVLSIPRNRKPAPITMLPTGAGQSRTITADRLDHRNARWLPDGKRILFQASEPGRDLRVWIQSIDGGPPRPVTPERALGTLITPDARFVLARAERRFRFYPIDGGDSRPIEALHEGDVPVRFADDGASLYVATFGKIPARLSKVNILTGVRTTIREVMPADASGLINVGPVLITPDGKTSVYSYTRLLSDLFVVDGL
ncbi:MAG TPA: protein kinase [Thermoanaerobaculia bacterium]|nr:protein kinase [Thermoanaerobaculia bacterium]